MKNPINLHTKNTWLFKPEMLDYSDKINKPHFLLYEQDVLINNFISDFYKDTINFLSGSTREITEKEISTPVITSEYTEVILAVPHFFPVISVNFTLRNSIDSSVSQTTILLNRSNKREPVVIKDKKFVYYIFNNDIGIAIGFDYIRHKVHVYYRENPEGLYPIKIRVLL